jgi:hypothetical protein
MAPYTPPNSHYSQMDVSEYDEDKLFAFIGKTGKKFYWLTHKLGLDYLWYDKEPSRFGGTRTRISNPHTSLMLN